MSNKLEAKGQNILKEQYYEREQRSRQETKLENGRSATYNTISSLNGLRQHIKQWRQVAIFLYERYRIKTLGKIEIEMIIAFLKERLAEGKSEKSLKASVTAINHVMVGSGVWKENQKISLTQLRKEKMLSSQKGATHVYKDLTAEEWRERHPQKYKTHQELIDFLRAFGLRESELFGKDGQYKGLTFRNLGHVEGSTILFAEVVGKGGKYRFAEVRSDMREQMWAKYGQQSRVYQSEYLIKSVEERERILKASSKAKERIFESPPRGLPLHINRSEYVQYKLQEKQLQ